ncbi:MAG: sarcosine oxidase subunit gamma family protein [Rhodoferax sp.]|jgi:sarcosine oxidase subunit gamma|nr:sarcosine oxidase subunit gamma family protein [Rhodoferax sp.]
MSNVVLESPLAALTGLGQRVLSVDGARVTLGELAFTEMLNIRGNPAHAGFVEAVHSATGLSLPQVANTASVGATGQLLWLGPDEWVLKFPPSAAPYHHPGAAEAMEATLRGALAGQHVSLVPVGHGFTTLTVQGEGAADLLARGCPLDLHPRAFGAGAVAQSHVAKAGATLLCLSAGTHYELTVRRSFADYLYRWLCEAGAA